jgi:hypothetical protein
MSGTFSLSLESDNKAARLFYELYHPELGRSASALSSSPLSARLPNDYPAFDSDIAT